MSQKKIDSRKLTKGDMLHAAKQKFKIIVLVVAVVLVCCGVGAGFICYNQGYSNGNTAGENSGYEEAYELWSSYYASEEETDTTAESDTTAEDTGAEDTTAAEETSAQ